MDPLVGAALVSGVGGFLSSAFGGGSGAEESAQISAQAQRERMTRSPAQRIAEQMFLRQMQQFPQAGANILQARHPAPAAPSNGAGGYFAYLQQQGLAQKSNLRARVEAQMNKLASSLYGVNPRVNNGTMSV